MVSGGGGGGNVLWQIFYNATIPKIQIVSIISSKGPKSFTQVSLWARAQWRLYYSHMWSGGGRGFS